MTKYQVNVLNTFDGYNAIEDADDARDFANLISYEENEDGGVDMVYGKFEDAYEAAMDIVNNEDPYVCLIVGYDDNDNIVSTKVVGIDSDNDGGDVECAAAYYIDRHTCEYVREFDDMEQAIAKVKNTNKKGLTIIVEWDEEEEATQYKIVR